jgi:hypothetical protein
MRRCQIIQTYFGNALSVILIYVGMIIIIKIGVARVIKEQYVLLITLWSTGKNICENLGAIFVTQVE